MGDTFNKLIASIIILMVLTSSLRGQSFTALIIDGQNNHGAWPKNTAMMKDYLEETGLFKVDVERTAITWQGPHSVASNGEEPLEGLIDSYAIGNKKKTKPVDEPSLLMMAGVLEVTIKVCGEHAIGRHVCTWASVAIAETRLPSRDRAS
jgi:hypothetical protein